jgi:hypothetical protein
MVVSPNVPRPGGWGVGVAVGAGVDGAGVAVGRGVAVGCGVAATAVEVGRGVTVGRAEDDGSGTAPIVTSSEASAALFAPVTG